MIPEAKLAPEGAARSQLRTGDVLTRMNFGRRRVEFAVVLWVEKFVKMGNESFQLFYAAKFCGGTVTCGNLWCCITDRPTTFQWSIVGRKGPRR